jgi:hypothetical protein
VIVIDGSPRVRHHARETELREIPISLIRGGSLYRAQERIWLVRSGSWTLERRLIIAIALAWLPLIVLTAARGDLRELTALLTDYRVYARVLIAIPLLLIGQIAIERRFRDHGQHFLDARIVRTSDLSRFREIARKTRRLRDARLPEILVVVAIYLQLAVTVDSGPLASAPWAKNVATGALTAAGYYSTLVTQPLVLLLMAIVLWKWLIWAAFLFRVARLDLQVDATNGDLTGGLGFVGDAPRAFVPAVVAVAAVVGANWRAQVVAGEIVVQALIWPAAILALITLGVFLLPLAVFTPILLREKRRSVRRYGSIQHRMSLRFRQKWTEEYRERPESADLLLAGPDVSSLADLTSAFSTVDTMRTYPFRAQAVIALAAALAVPLIPSVTSQIPLTQIIKGLLQAVR